MISKELFLSPESKYSIVPFWFWNDDSNIEHLKWQMHQMKEQHIDEVVISPRVGLAVSYL